MRDRPQTESHFTRDQNVLIVKEVHISPGQRTVLLMNRWRGTQEQTDSVQHSLMEKILSHLSAIVSLVYVLDFISYLFGSFPSLHRAYRQAKSS